MSARVDVRVASCVVLPEPDADAQPLAAAFARAGVVAAWVGWDDPHAAWDAPIPTVIRATWNYPQAPAAFEAWLSRAAAAAPLWNPAAIVRANLRKRYLLELAARGVAACPTVLVERGETRTPAQLSAIAPRIVIKPEIGAGSWKTRAFAASERDAAAAWLAEITCDRPALVQPYIDAVDTYGERSLIWIDGAWSHAIRKAPRFAGGVERTTGPHPIADDERALADAALAVAAPADQLLYARVDTARDAAGAPMIMELELTEPSLFFAYQPGSADRFVAGLMRRLRGAL